MLKFYFSNFLKNSIFLILTLEGWIYPSRSKSFPRPLMSGLKLFKQACAVNSDKACHPYIHISVIGFKRTEKFPGLSGSNFIWKKACVSDGWNQPAEPLYQSSEKHYGNGVQLSKLEFALFLMTNLNGLYFMLP